MVKIWEINHKGSGHPTHFWRIVHTLRVYLYPISDHWCIFLWLVYGLLDFRVEHKLIELIWNWKWCLSGLSQLLPIGEEVLNPPRCNETWVWVHHYRLTGDCQCLSPWKKRGCHAPCMRGAHHLSCLRASSILSLSKEAMSGRSWVVWGRVGLVPTLPNRV